MEEEVFSELENKIERIIIKIQNYKKEKGELEGTIEEQKGKIQEIESVNETLKKGIEEIKNSYEIRQKKLDQAAEKIKNLLIKLETVEE